MWGGRWEVGVGVHVWELMYTRDGFMPMHGKSNTVLESKIKEKLKFKKKKNLTNVNLHSCSNIPMRLVLISLFSAKETGTEY